MANRGKEILLLCLAVTTLVTAIYTFRSDSGAKYREKSPRLAAQTEISRQRAARGSDLRPEAIASRPPVVPRATVTPINRNPFSRPVGAPSAAPAPEPAKPAGAGAPPAPQPAAALTPAPSPAVPGPQAASVLPPLSVQAAPAPTAPLLTGVIGNRTGDQTAVIRVGELRYFARAGDKVAGRYLVQSVSDRQVVLAGAEGKLILKMGGSQ